MKEYIKTFYTNILRYKYKNNLTLCETLNPFQLKCRYCVYNTTSFRVCNRLKDVRQWLR